MGNKLKVLLYIFMAIVISCTCFPLIYAIGGSFKSLEDFLVGGLVIIPQKLHFENYVTAWEQANFSRYTLNSIVFAGASVIGTIITTTMAGYTLSRSEFPGNKLIIGIFGFMLFLLEAVTLYPIFLLCKNLGLLNSVWGMIITQVAAGQPLYAIIVMGYCNGISKQIDEAARIDGASFFRIYYQIIFPMIKPIIATVAILQFREAWNSFMRPLAFSLSRPEIRPLTVGVVMLKDQGEGVTAWNLMMAGTVLSIIPILIVYLFMNRYFIAGITQGSVKG